ncbi:MAG: enoyl-CoA hydratase/isomerase family protein, partial [Lachnospiraceae bacterium]|nr:enoyl-CoA hydratase/isomerase family protein [Lachnospiraceae bacterium]
ICNCTIHEAVKVIVLTGAGKHFSAGGDIREFKELIESETYIEEKSIQLAGDTAEAVRRCPKPVIAMINGAAAGAGCSLALACDFRVMEPNSRLSMAFIQMGLPGDTGGIYYLQKLLGTARTTEFIMLGRAIKGEEAYQIGLASRLALEGRLYETTMELAEELAKKPMLAIKRQKEMLLHFFYKDIKEFTEMEGKYMVECSKSEDFAEAVNAFLEKRKPVFTGK